MAKKSEKDEYLHHLYEENHDWMVGVASVWISNKADAEDIVQDVFLIGAKKIDALMKHDNPRAWLNATLKYLILNYNRLHANRVTVPLEECADLVAPENGEPIWHTLPSQLSDIDKDILTWYFENRMSHEEISKKLGITAGACRVRVCRLVRICRELLKK